MDELESDKSFAGTKLTVVIPANKDPHLILKIHGERRPRAVVVHVPPGSTVPMDPGKPDGPHKAVEPKLEFALFVDGQSYSVQAGSSVAVVARELRAKSNREVKITCDL